MSPLNTQNVGEVNPEATNWNACVTYANEEQEIKSIWHV
jgi:hypothetical protein